MTKPRSWIGLLVGLAGAGLLGWTLSTIFTSPDCLAQAALNGGQGCSTNPPGWVALAIPGSVLLAIAGGFLGGGAVVFSSIFLAVGLSALVPTVLGQMSHMALFGWLFGGIFVLCGLLPFIGALTGRGLVARKQAMAQSLMQGGTKAVGTIVEVTDTGVTLNQNPRVTIRMRVAPLDGSPPVERSKTVVVPRVAIPRAGERYPVWYDRSDAEKWMFGTAMDETAPAEVKEMFARARAAGGEADENGEEAGPVEELEALTRLWRDGALTDREFADAKARLLPRIGRT